MHNEIENTAMNAASCVCWERGSEEERVDGREMVLHGGGGGGGGVVPVPRRPPHSP